MDKVQIYFRESSRQDLENILGSIDVLGESCEARTGFSADTEKIFTAAVDAGLLGRLSKSRKKSGKKAAKRFALGKIGYYSKDWGLSEEPFVHIDNHPEYPDGIRFSYQKRDAVRARGKKTVDETLGCARIEFVRGSDTGYDVVRHAFATYGQGPAVTSTYGDEDDIPLVLYISERRKQRVIEVDREKLGMLDVMIRGFVELGKEGFQTGIEDGIRYADMMSAALSDMNADIETQERLKFYRRLGEHYESLGKPEKAVKAYEAILSCAEDEEFAKKDDITELFTTAAKSALERLRK